MASPQQKGREYEQKIALSFGGEVVEGSGNKPFCKLDVRGQKILISAKWTGKESFSVTPAIFDEAVRAIDGPGGLGGSTIPAVATSVGGEDVIVLRTSDFVRIVQEDLRLAIPSKGEARRSTSKTPALFRDE